MTSESIIKHHPYREAILYQNLLDYSVNVCFPGGADVCPPGGTFVCSSGGAYVCKRLTTPNTRPIDLHVI